MNEIELFFCFIWVLSRNGALLRYASNDYASVKGRRHNNKYPQHISLFQ